MPAKKSQSISLDDLSKKVRSAVETVAKKHPGIVKSDTNILLFPKNGTMGFFLRETIARNLEKGATGVVAAEILAASKIDGKAYARKQPDGTIIVGFQVNIENLQLRM